mgnify:CR=1 FL=1
MIFVTGSFHMQENHLDAGINRRAFEFNVPLKKTALPQQFDGRIDAVIQKAAEKKTLYVQAVKMSEDGKKYHHPSE